MSVPPAGDPQRQGYPPAHRPRRDHRPDSAAGYGQPWQQAATGYPTAYPAASPSAGPVAGQPGAQVFWTGQQRANNKLVFTVVMSVIGGLALLIALGYIALASGLSSTSVAFVLALVPLAIVLLGVRWVDRWEPEPKAILLVALVWGAGVAVLSALILNTSIQLWILQRTRDPEVTSTATAVVVAPIVEETVKAAGVLLLYIFRRRHVNGPVDGVVYAATVAAGFAFTENVLYFSRYTGEFGEVGVAEVFVMRGVFSPFAHALFTSCIGIAIGLAARSRRRWLLAVTLPAGLLTAMVLHGLWNGSALLSGNFVITYMALHVPLFLCMVALLFWLRRQEAALIRARLSEYGQAGWFAAHEVAMLSSLRLRSQAKAWAMSFGEEAKTAMVAFQQEATRLAFHRQRVRRHQRADAAAEAALLDQIRHQRAVFGHALSRRY